MCDKLKKFQKEKQKTKDIIDQADSAIQNKQASIETESKNIQELQGIKTSFLFVHDMYANVPNEKIKTMPTQEFDKFISPLVGINASGGTVAAISGSSQEYLDEADRQYAILSATSSTSGSFASNTGSIASQHPSHFPGKAFIIEQYELGDQHQKDIDYIRNELPKITPDRTRDFETFINKFNGFKGGEEQYQDLIGARSMFFQGFIFKFSMDNFSLEYPRKEAIKKFVFGNTPYDARVDSTILLAHSLYVELSSQNSSGSVKMANTSSHYNEGLYKRIISTIASLLKLRSYYFSI